MTIKPRMRKALAVTAWLLCTAILFVFLGFVNHEQEAMRCSGVEINITDLGAHEFIDHRDILSLVESKGKLTGKALGSINTALLEKIVLTNPYVKSVEVYSTVGGKLHVELRQRNPIVRIINQKDEQFYIDEEGRFMPLSDQYTPPVLVASGYIFNTFSEMKVGAMQSRQDSTVTSIPRMIDQVYAFSAFIARDTFWVDNAEQLYVNAQQEIELIPRIGNHSILFGDTTMIADKFNKLKVFYREGLNNTGWNNYSLINLKYKGQVVCTKK